MSALAKTQESPTGITDENVCVFLLSFLAAAIAVGSSTLEEHAEAIEDKEFPSAQLISAKEARELGIKAIASGRQKK